VCEEIEAGDPLRGHGQVPKAFDRLYVNMIKAGEAGGALEIILKRLAEFQERSSPQSARSKAPWSTRCRGHLRRGHPRLHHAWIVPKFEKIFADFGVELPAMTVALIQASRTSSSVTGT
jgi:type IV pilus assembly protein PilC